jgi:hypothetical protein
MGLNARKVPSAGGNFKRPPALRAGTYPARLVQLIDLGVQEQRPYKGQEKPPHQEIYTTYEMVDEFLKDEDGEEMKDKPRWLSEDFKLLSLNSDRATSTKRYMALDPELKFDGDWSQLLGVPAMITISADKDKKGNVDDEGNLKIYNNIVSVQTMRDKDAKNCEPLVNETKLLDLTDPDLEVFLALPEWLRDKIKNGLDFDGSKLDKMLGNIDEADEVQKRRDKIKEEKEEAVKEDTPETEEDEEGW